MSAQYEKMKKRFQDSCLQISHLKAKSHSRYTPCKHTRKHTHVCTNTWVSFVIESRNLSTENNENPDKRIFINVPYLTRWIVMKTSCLTILKIFTQFSLFKCYWPKSAKSYCVFSSYPGQQVSIYHKILLQLNDRNPTLQRPPPPPPPQATILSSKKVLIYQLVWLKESCT